MMFGTDVKNNLDFIEYMKKPSKKNLDKWEKLAIAEILEWQKFLKYVRSLRKE